MAKEKLILFDVDGVMVDSFEEIYVYVSDLIKKQGDVEISREEFRHFFEGNPLENISKYIQTMPHEENVTKEDTAGFLSAYSKAKVFENGITEVVQKLAKNNTLVVITSTLIEAVTEKIAEKNLDVLFAAFLGPRAAIHKDDKIKMAIEEFGKNAEEVIFISDTSGDILEAKKIPVKTIAVSWGYHPRETLEKVAPDAIVDSPQELLEQLS